MKIAISGSTGLVGSALVEFLFNKGYSVQCLRRLADGDSFWNFDNLNNSESPLDVFIHLAGENVASGRWSPSRMEAILQSRIQGTRKLIDYIETLPARPQLFICASAVGYYGSRGIDVLTESSPPGSGFLAEVCKQWEAETKRLTAMGVRVVNLRFGMILSPSGGALGKMILPFKMFLGGVIGSGKQRISWVSIDDVQSIIDFVIKKDSISGPVNVVTPHSVNNRELTKALGKSLGVLTLFTVPAFMAKFIFGQMAEEMLLASTDAKPKVLMNAGYEFLDTDLQTVLNKYIK